MKLAISPDGQTFATGMSDGRVIVWDLNENRIRRIHGSGTYKPGDEVYHLGFSPDGRLLASGNSNNEMKLWDVKTGDALGTLPPIPEGLAPQAEAIFAMRFTDSADYLVTFRRSLPAKSHLRLVLERAKGRGPTSASGHAQSESASEIRCQGARR